MKTEQEMLLECLEQGALDEIARDAFERWSENIYSGKWIGALTVKERAWLLAEHARLGLDPGAENLVSSGAVKPSARERESLAAFHGSLGEKGSPARPLVPPHRRPR